MAAARGPAHPEKEWQSPSRETIAIQRPEGGRAVIVVADPTAPHSARPIAHPPMPRVDKEWHGTFWLADTPPQFVHERYWIFQSPSGICIIDHKEARMLVNHVLEPVVHDESRLVWVAMARRSLGRHDEFLPDGFRDSFKIILLSDETGQPVPTPRIHMVELPGVAFSPPVFNPTGDKAVVAVGLGPGMVAVVVDLANGELTAQHPLPDEATPTQMVELSFQDLFTEFASRIAAGFR